MADSESDLETDGLELALDTLCDRHCRHTSSLKSKGYCAEFCEVMRVSIRSNGPRGRYLFVANATSFAS